jgi:hypothetical protein
MEFQDRLGSGFLWSKCSERVVLSEGPGDIVVLRGFEPGSLLPPISGTRSIEPPDLFPDGCPDRPYDRFMAEVHFPEVTVTINAPYGIAGQAGDDFGQFDTEAGVEAIARSLRLRQPGQ